MLLFGQSSGAEDAFVIASLPQAPYFINSAILESGVGKQLQINSTAQSVGASYARTLKCNPGDVSANYPIFAQVPTSFEVNANLYTESPSEV